MHIPYSGARKVYVQSFISEDMVKLYHVKLCSETFQRLNISDLQCTKCLSSEPLPHKVIHMIAYYRPDSESLLHIERCLAVEAQTSPVGR